MTNDYDRYRKVVLVALGGSVAFIVLLTIISDRNLLEKYNDFVISDTMVVVVFFSLFVPGIWSQWKARQFVPITKGLHILYSMLLPMLTHSFVFMVMLYWVPNLLKIEAITFQSLWSYLFHSFSIYLVFIYGISATVIDAATPRNQKDNRFGSEHDPNVLINSVTQQPISISTIFYITSDTPYSFLHTIDQKYSYTETLPALEQRLLAHYFVRIHPTTIVNLHYVDRYKLLFNGNYDLVLSNQVVVRMNKSYTANFFKQYHALRGEVLISK